MSKQLIGIGAAANDGTGDNLRAAFTKVNANANELYNAIDQVGLRRAPIIAFAGDSIAQQFGSAGSLTISPLGYALSVLTHRDFYIDGSTGNIDGTGGYNWGVGGSPASYLTTNYLSNGNCLAKLQAKTVKPDIVIIQSMQNNAMGSGVYTDLNPIVQHYRDFCAGALAAGVSLCVIFPRPPYNGAPATGVASAHQLANNLLRQYADATPGVIFVDYLPSVKSTSDANENNGASSVINWRGTGAGNFSADGVHPSTLTMRAIAPLLVPILDQFGRPVRPRACSFGAWDNSATGLNFNNVYGRDAMLVGTGGVYNGANNANVAGSNNADAARRWALTDGNGIVATPSLITHADGYQRQRLTLSGTASAAATVTLSLAFFADVTSGSYDLEALLDFTNVQGLTSWTAGMAAATLADENVSQVGALNDKYFLRSFAPVVFSNAGFSNKPVQLILNFANGATASGTVDFGRVGAWKV